MPAEPKLRVFLDSNVFISGLYSSGKAPGKILENFIEGKIEIVISQQVLEEVVRAIREKLPEALPALNIFLSNTPPEIVRDPGESEIEAWAGFVHIEDAAILAAAISSHPDYLVTGDNHFLNNLNLKNTGISIISPSGLWKLLNE
jgi:putative PIN family toxin of toxin-antitoxin system